MIRKPMCAGESSDDDDEAVWHRRQLSRRKGIEKVKATPKYEFRRTDPYRPLTPDPTTRIPKRDWEYRMMEWRQALRRESIVTLMLADLIQWWSIAIGDDQLRLSCWPAYLHNCLNGRHSIMDLGNQLSKQWNMYHSWAARSLQIFAKLVQIYVLKQARLELTTSTCFYLEHIEKQILRRNNILDTHI